MTVRKSIFRRGGLCFAVEVEDVTRQEHSKPLAVLGLARDFRGQPMKIAFVHQNFPGQFLRLAGSFAAEGHEVVGLGMVKQCSIPGVKYFSYEAVPGPEDAPYQNRYSPVIPRLRRAYGVAHRGKALASQGFEPDVVVVNTGWGENLFLKDIWPKAKHVAYFEYY